MASNKKRAGVYKKSRIKTSGFLPGVFQTNLNKRWLDSTLDQMVSKSDLKPLEGYFGDRSGKYSTSQDQYVMPPVNTVARTKTQLAPAILTLAADGSIDNALTFDDVIAAVNSNFSDYNYNTAYASAIYGYHPPIDPDKLVNFTNYYWVEELPVYESVKDTGTPFNPVSDSLRREVYTLTDDNNSFKIDNNMLIKFVGFNWDPAIQGKTYIVTGVGENIRMMLYLDENGKRYYTSSNKGDVTFAGYWDNSKYYTVTPNTVSEYWDSNKTPQSMIAAYNSDNSTTKLPIFEGFNFSNIGSNPDKFTAGVLVKFSGDWDIDELERAKIYYTEIDETTGNLNLRVIIDAEYNLSGNIATSLGFVNLPEDQPILDLLEGWDKDYWDSEVNQVVLKDYHVIAKHDGFQTAWSRNNNWVSINTIHKLKDLLGNGFGIGEYINQDRIARRPIIEFNKNMSLWNFGAEFPQLETWVGIIDFILDPADSTHTVQNDGSGNLSYPDSADLPVPVGSRVIFAIPELNSDHFKKVFQLESDGTLTPVIELDDNKTAFVNSTVHDSLADWIDSDAYFDGSSWRLGQQKIRVNQPPLFRLYDYQGQPLENYPGSAFVGSKVFGYKIGSGNIDSELGLKLSYKDSVKGAEYEFENYIITQSYTESFTSSIDEKISHYQKIPGYYFFKIDGYLSYVYTKNEIIAGTRQEHVYEITDNSEDLVIPFGYDDWRFRKEVLFHAYDNRAVLTEIANSGVYLEKIRTVIAGDNQTLTFHSLIPDVDVMFTTADGTVIPDDGTSVVPGVVITKTGIEIKIEFSNFENEVVYVNTDPKIFGAQVDAKILIFRTDALYHSVFVNGKPLSTLDYQVNNDNVVISKNLLAVGDLVDFKYYNNSAKSDENTALPDTMNTNPNNKMMETFTVGETLSHWSSVISSQPGIQGEAYGYNNYNEIVKINNIGGTVHIHADISIMHDLAYSNAALDVTGSLIEQGADWDAFVERFKNQVRRLYSTKPYNTVFDIVSDALNAVTLNRKGSNLYRDSNMVYGHLHNLEVLEVIPGNNIYYSKYVVNGDDNTRDHVYLYLTEDRDSDGKFIQRLLTKDVDYTLVGNRIDLLITPKANTVNGKFAFLTLSYHHMGEESFVPPSSVKLKLKNAYVPQVVDDVLFTHDGRQIHLAAGAELEDVSSENFDPVNAAVFDLEKRIYAGLVSVDALYGDRYDAVVNDYANAYAYLPSQHHETWYTLEQVNDYIEKFYQQWARERDIEGLNIENYYNPADPFTWNYSSVDIGKHFTGNRLPGHWVGAYTVLFGTATPHLTPWHMLGFTFKPTWWDGRYDWVDTAKRAALLTALKCGTTDLRVGDTEVRNQEPVYARYYWDWDNQCPVDASGNLVSPDQVLGSVSPVSQAAAFEFGDWGPVEQLWRSSAQGYMALVDAIVKLNPNRAWSEFFQPGTSFKNKFTTSDLHLYTKKLPSVEQYPVPGKIYDSLVRSVYFKNEIDRFPKLESSLRIADGQGTLEAKTKISYVASGSYEQDGQTFSRISGISVVSRGRGYTSPPSVLTTFTSAQNQFSELEVNLDQVPYVACGISQAQYNYSLRRQYDIDLEQVYSTLTTRLSQKLGGFTSKHLVNLYADSSALGAFRLSESDYYLGMYQGYPVEIVTASQVTITKTETGYRVAGVSSQRQEFEFYEPDMSNTNGATTVGVGNVSVRKYKRFAGTPSVIQYGAKLAKIQDTYNFIRGYWHWMELSGYQLTKSGDAAALGFVQWAITADDDDSITIKIGNEIKFTPVFGSVYEYNRFHYHRNDILDYQGDIVSNEDVLVDRLDGTVTIKTKDGQDIGSVTSAVVLHEHILIINNVSSLGLDFYNPEKALRYHRLYVSGQITDDWRGEKNALGYLVFDDRIVQNFDSSVSAVDDFYRTDVTEFNPALTKTKDLTIGNIDREWIASLGLNKNTVTNFYQGAIKQAGTRGVIEKIARTTVLDHGTTTIDISEQFMFNQSYFGENKLDNHIEIQLSASDVNNRPQIIKFAELAEGELSDNVLSYPMGSRKIVHQGDPTFDTIAFADSSLELLTAGEVLTTETTYQTLSVETMSEVFDTRADYANIPTWTTDISYKLGDLVRHQGKLYKCTVNATGLVVVEEGVEAIGTITNPVFPNGTVANIAGTTTTLERSTTAYEEIQAVGTTVDPEMLPTETLVIDGTSISFSKTAQQIVVIGDALLRGNISNPSIADATGQTITINGVVIDFNEDTPDDQQQSFTGSGGVDVTPADVMENITGVASQQTYAISQALSPSTYSVVDVTVDGLIYDQGTDWTLSGQDITFVNPVFLGGEDIEITMTHQTVITDLEDTFTVSVVTLGTNWSVSLVTVNGIAQVSGVDYNVAGQDVVFTTGNEPENGDSIVVTVTHIPASFNLEEIVDKINDENIPEVTANISTDGLRRLDIRMTTTNPDALLVLGASATNALLGFSVDGRTARPPSETQIVNDILTLADIVSQINLAGVPGVVAGNLGSQIVLTSVNTTLTLTGSAVAILGLQPQYNADLITVPTFVTMIQAVEDINNTLEDAGIATVTATIDNNRIKISSTENVLNIGNTDFNTISGLPSGELVSLEEDILNEFDPAEWQDISDQDPALISIWVADDSAYEVNEVQSVQTKFYSWNVFQAQNSILYTKSTDGTDCGICAGTATRDGNDAEVTTNIDHKLQVGDYVMLLNTTTVPNIDGIHRVTKLGVGSNGNRIFYIDRFIEECGNAVSVIPLRTQRFNTVEELETATSTVNWNFPTNSYVWTNYDQFLVRSTNVYRIDSFPVTERTTTARVTNQDIQNAVIYDSNTNQSVAEFEVFDPIRGIIPGVAARELDFKTAFDPATYNVSTDTYYSTDENDAWANNQVGQRWWDTSKVRYYDYDQGPLSYRAANWGRQFAGSEIAVWEWTKSIQPPDEYANTVTTGAEIEMFGVVATGEPYSTFDPVANETLYYYTQVEEWDAEQGKYRNVYYFWVKNKTTIWNKNHLLTAKSLADIISNPTANNIGWIAAISNDAIIISNVNYYLTDDSTVLQINKKNTGHAHNNWMLIARDRDQIPEYWYIGMRNNLAGIDANDAKIPDFDLHPLNRYGDDRSIRQAWFDDIRDARYNVVLMINELLQDVNIQEDLKSTWDTTISKRNDLGELILPRRMWKWADYISQDYTDYLQPTLDILSTLDLPGIDTDLHQAVALEIIDPDTELDRSETYYYINGEWQLVRKNNATIEFDPLKLSLTHGWDTSPWDMISWDNTNIAEYWRVIIDACRYDLFTAERIQKFNQLFFGIVEYTLSKITQPNWVHKSTYISLYVTSDVETKNRRYKRNQINEILGYVNTVKPFHTKISNIYDIYNASDEVALEIEYTELKNITVDISATNQNFVGTVIDSTEVSRTLVYVSNDSRQYRIATGDAVLDENNWRVSEVYVGTTLLTESLDYVVVGQTITFEVAPTEAVTVEIVPWQENVINGGTFSDDDTQFDVIYDHGEFHQPYNYTNSGGTVNEYQGTTADIRPLELLNIVVQTNVSGDTVDSDTRTFVYIQDNNENVGVYGLADANKTTLAADFERNQTVAQLTDGSAFALNGFAYIDGEVVKFDRSGNTLYIRQRGLNGTFAIHHEAGSIAVDVTNTVLSTFTNKFGDRPRFNQPGVSILDSTTAVIPNELAAAGQGIEI
jgi:hypothetical protein